MNPIKTKVVLKTEKFMGNYFGMNSAAGKELHFNHIPPKGTIYIDKVLTKPEQGKVIVHEKIEEYMMRRKHLPYNRAHKVANNFELHSHVHNDNRAKVKKWEKKYQI